MPIYEFECTTCATRFDRLQKLSDPDPSACPECGKPTVKRRLTAPSFRLAGSGWYETDFKKDGDKKRNLVDKSEPKKSEDKPADNGSAGAKADSAKTDAGKGTSDKVQSKPAEKAHATKPESKSTPATDK